MLKTAELLLTVLCFCIWLPKTILLLQNKMCLGKGDKVWNLLGLETYSLKAYIAFYMIDSFDCGRHNVLWYCYFS